MRLKLLILSALVFAAGAVRAAEPPVAVLTEPPVARVAPDPYDSCVGVWCRSGLASGTAITGAPPGKTYVLTAKHVTDAPSAGVGRAVYWRGETHPAALVASHPTADVALLVVDAVIPARPVAAPVAGGAVAIKAYGQGHSFGAPRTGRVTSVGATVGLAIAVAPGDSGGGLLNGAGEVVAVLSGRVPGRPVGVAYGAGAVRDLAPNAGAAAGSAGGRLRLADAPEPRAEEPRRGKVLIAHLSADRPLPDADGLVYDAAGRVVMSYTLDAAGVEVTPEMVREERLATADGGDAPVSVARWPGAAAGYTVVRGAGRR